MSTNAWHNKSEDVVNPYMLHFPVTFSGGHSSVDFCERNFNRVYWVAEPYNTVSALPLMALAVLGAMRCIRAKDGSLAEAWLFFTLFLVGVGTVALHATLTTLGQALDEIPMLLLTTWLAAQIERARGAKHMLIPTTIFSLASVAWYLKYQSLYALFILCYSCIVAYVVLRLAYLAFKKSDKDDIRTNAIKPLFLFGVASYVLCGFVVR